jgi:uncharacterized protein YjbI with pentapeptide repeats
MEVLKTIFSVLATLGTITAIFLTYASNDFKDARSNLDSVINRLTEPANKDRPVFRQTSAAAMLPHFYAYKSAYGSYPFRAEIRALLSGYFAEKSQRNASLRVAVEQLHARAYPNNPGDLRADPEVLKVAQLVETRRAELSGDPLQRAMSDALNAILKTEPELLTQGAHFVFEGLQLRPENSGLRIEHPTLLKIAGKLHGTRLAGPATMVDATGAEFIEAEFTVTDATFCSFMRTEFKSCKGSFTTLVFCELLECRLLDSQLSLEHVSNCSLAGADFSDSRLDGKLWAHLDLSGACLLNTGLQVAHLDNVDLQGALLCNADLSGVSETTQVNWRGAIFNDQTRPPRGLRLADLERSGAVRSNAQNLERFLSGHNRPELRQRLISP